MLTDQAKKNKEELAGAAARFFNSLAMTPNFSVIYSQGFDAGYAQRDAEKAEVGRDKSNYTLIHNQYLAQLKLEIERQKLQIQKTGSMLSTEILEARSANLRVKALDILIDGLIEEIAMIRAEEQMSVKVCDRLHDVVARVKEFREAGADPEKQ